MSKRRKTAHRTESGSGDRFDNLKVGDTISAGDILGSVQQSQSLPPVGWLRGPRSPFGFDVLN